MEKGNTLSRLFGLLGLLIAAGAVSFALLSLDAEPVLLRTPEAATEAASQLMDAVCRGDFEGAERLLYGAPELGAGRDPESPVGQLLWEAYIRSLQWEPVGACYAADSGLALDVKLTGLSLVSVTENLGDYAQGLLTLRVEQAEDMSAVYDENNAYREDFVMEVLLEAAELALERDALTGEQTVTLHLAREDGSWKVIADEALIAAISGDLG